MDNAVELSSLSASYIYKPSIITVAFIVLGKET